MDSFVIADRLAKLDPANADWQRDLSITLSEIGMLKVKQRDIKGARQAFQDSLDIRQQLAQSDPNNATWQRDLVVAMVDYAQVARNPKAVLSRGARHDAGTRPQRAAGAAIQVHDQVSQGPGGQSEIRHGVSPAWTAGSFPWKWLQTLEKPPLAPISRRYRGAIRGRFFALCKRHPDKSTS